MEKDRYNTLDFKPIKTTGLKITARLQDGESGGIIEWKVNSPEDQVHKRP